MDGELTNGDTLCLFFWGSSHNLEIIFDVYDGESILPAQQLALEKFLKKGDLLDSVRLAVEEYIRKTKPVDLQLDNFECFQKHVDPRSIFIKRSNNADRITALLCEYIYDFEDGIAIVFVNEQLSRIGKQNIIL